jgi:hypothetical protein
MSQSQSTIESTVIKAVRRVERSDIVGADAERMEGGLRQEEGGGSVARVGEQFATRTQGG